MCDGTLMHKSIALLSFKPRGPPVGLSAPRPPPGRLAVDGESGNPEMSRHGRAGLAELGKARGLAPSVCRSDSCGACYSTGANK